MSPSHGRWRLADHVRACRVGDQVILLDLIRNRYLGVGGPLLPALARTIGGWPQAGDEGAGGLEEEKLAAQIATLVERQLLSPWTQPLPVHTRLDEPLGTLPLEDALQATRFGWRPLVQLWADAAVTAFRLRRSSLAAIARAVATRRQRAGTRPTASHERLSAAVAEYMAVRPFVFSAHDRCLHDSLTLVRFLGRRGLFPRWVVGVRTRPFAAHSWVQDGPVVLNDLHENVRRYQPILVV